MFVAIWNTGGLAFITVIWLVFIGEVAGFSELKMAAGVLYILSTGLLFVGFGMIVFRPKKKGGKR